MVLGSRSCSLYWGKLHTLFILVMIDVYSVIVFARLILPSEFVPLGKIMCAHSSEAVILLCILIQHTGQYFLRASFKDMCLVTEHLFQHTSAFPFILPFLCHSFFLSLFLALPLFLSLSFSLCYFSFSLCQPSAVSCLDKLMYKFPLAPHHGWLPYQGQESALQHLQHFIGILSECRER